MAKCSGRIKPGGDYYRPMLWTTTTIIIIIVENGKEASEREHHHQHHHWKQHRDTLQSPSIIELAAIGTRASLPHWKNSKPIASKQANGRF